MLSRNAKMRKNRNKSCLNHSKNFNTEAITNTNLLNETRFDKTKGRVYKI